MRQVKRVVASEPCKDNIQIQTKIRILLIERGPIKREGIMKHHPGSHIVCIGRSEVRLRSQPTSMNTEAEYFSPLFDLLKAFIHAMVDKYRFGRFNFNWSRHFRFVREGGVVCGEESLPTELTNAAWH